MGCEMVDFKFTTNWFEANANYWDILKAHLVKHFENDLNCLDIGTFEGRSAVWMAQNLIGANGSLHIVDPVKDHYKKNLLHNISALPNSNLVKLHTGDSVTELPAIYKEFGEYFHFIYIDAGKTAADNCLNALVAERMLHKNGLLVVDDYLWGGHLIDQRLSPKLGIDMYSNLSLLTAPQNTPRSQAVFLKVFDNEKLENSNK
jgi:predicted O-methyltransferase YrrM